MADVELTRSAHTDTFCRDHLPPPDQWPEFRFELPELAYPDRLNCATVLLDDVIAEHGADRPCLLAPGGERWSYAELRSAANRVRGATARLRPASAWRIRSDSVATMSWMEPCMMWGAFRGVA